MISTIGVHQPPQTPAIRSANNSASYNHTIQHYNPLALNGIVQPERRLLNLQFLDLTDCTSLEDSGLKMIVECCPQLLYLFMRRCSTLTGKNYCIFEFTMLIDMTPIYIRYLLFNKYHKY